MEVKDSRFTSKIEDERGRGREGEGEKEIGRNIKKGKRKTSKIEG